jgi:hypothetical protein
MVAPTGPQDDTSAGTEQPAPSSYRSAGRTRFLVLRDRDGLRRAVARSAVFAVSEAEDGGCILLLPGGRIIQVDETLELVLEWLA